MAICMNLWACSTTVKGPITRKQYQLDVGCTDDMAAYRRAREEAMQSGKPKPPPPADCSVDDGGGSEAGK